MAKETSRFAALRELKDPKPEQAPAKRPRKLNPKAQAKLMASPDAPGETPPPLQTPPLAPEPVAEPAAETPRRGRGRPPGRRSNREEYEPTTLILNSEIKAIAQLSLQLRRKKKDGSMNSLSGLVDELLEEWVERYPPLPKFK